MPLAAPLNADQRASAWRRLAEEDLELRLLRAARRTDLDVLCLNETDLPEDSVEKVDRLVSRFLHDRFPVPSRFENDQGSHTSDP